MARPKKEIEENDEPIEEKKIEKKKGFRVKRMGFANGKRNYFVGDRNVLLIEGEIVDNDIYELFNDRAKEVFFEKA